MAAAVAVLQAITTAFTPRGIRLAIQRCVNSRTSSVAQCPYGAFLESQNIKTVPRKNLNQFPQNAIPPSQVKKSNIHSSLTPCMFFTPARIHDKMGAPQQLAPPKAT